MNDNRNIEIIKLQEDLATITVVWQDKKGEDICSLRIALLHSNGKVKTCNDGLKLPQLLSNVKFRKQNNF